MSIKPRTPAELRRIKDPVARARAANEAMDAHRAIMSVLADVRAEAAREALDGRARGGRVALAAELGITPQALTKILGRE